MPLDFDPMQMPAIPVDDNYLTTPHLEAMMAQTETLEET